MRSKLTHCVTFPHSIGIARTSPAEIWNEIPGRFRWSEAKPSLGVFDKVVFSRYRQIQMQQDLVEDFVEDSKIVAPLNRHRIRFPCVASSDVCRASSA